MQEEPSAGQKSHGTKMAPAIPKKKNELTNGNEHSKEPSATPKNQKPSSVPRSAQQVASDDHAERTQSFSRGEKPLSVVGSPNFFYMNAAYSSSVEVLPALYATVDLSKKTKNKNPAERASDNAVTLTRHQSKSSDSILEGSPPKFTHLKLISLLSKSSFIPSVNQESQPQLVVSVEKTFSTGQSIYVL